VSSLCPKVVISPVVRDFIVAERDEVEARDGLWDEWGRLETSELSLSTVFSRLNVVASCLTGCISVAWCFPSLRLPREGRVRASDVIEAETRCVFADDV
jgi:hypothetical protein